MTGPGRLLISAWPPRQADGGRPPFRLVTKAFRRLHGASFVPFELFLGLFFYAACCIFN